MDLTRNNIARNLSISPHRESVPYGDFSLEYVFSSDLYRRKFLAKLSDHRDQINVSLSNRFGFMVIADLIADLRLYSTIEKRGFLLVKDGIEIKCRNNLKLDIGKMILQSSEE